MRQSRYFLQMSYVGGAVLAMLAMLEPSALAQSNDDPPPQLQITSVEVDLGADTITINGQHFDNLDPDYAKPLVFLDDFELRVLSHAADVIGASLDAVPGDLLGDYIVVVQTGDAAEQYDDHCFGVDEAGEMSDCGDLPSDNWAQWDRVSIRHVPKGPPGAETDDTDLFTWKAGPARINNRKNKWGDPEFYQLLEDYTIDLRLILENYPNELARCDDRYLGQQRTKILERLEEAACVEWREDNESAVCPVDPSAPSKGYILLRDGKLTLRKGYRWDGPSIDAGERRIYPKPAALMRGSCVHDAFYDLLRMDIAGSDRYRFQKLADCMLFMLYRQDGYFFRKARSGFTIARVFGEYRADNDMDSWTTHALADAGPDQHLMCSPPEGVEVTLDSTGTKFASPSRIWKKNGVEIPGTTGLEQPTLTFSPGIHRIHLEVVDTDPDTDWRHDDSDDVVITVHQDSEPPVVTDFPDIEDVPNEPGVCGAHVEFSVGADDNCGCPEIECIPPSGSWFDVATTPVTCTGTDAAGNISAAVDFDVTVEDMEPPQIDGIPRPLTMWPPNHQYRTFDVADFVTSLHDNCTAPSAADVVIQQVTSDEPENADGGGDGNTLRDIVISADRKSVRLRSERQGGGNGRVYTVHLEVADSSGNLATAPFQVHVVDDSHGIAIDDGVAYSVFNGQKSSGRSWLLRGGHLP